MNKSIFKYLVLALALNSCTYDYINKANPLEGLVKLSEGYVSRAKIEVWGQKNYFAGYNDVVVALYDSLNLKNHITDAHISFFPVKTTGTGSSASVTWSPGESPDEKPVDGVFPGAIIFISPTSPVDKWKLNILVHNHDVDVESQTGFDIVVDSLPFPEVTEFKSDTPDSTVFVLSMIEPARPVIGLNNIEFSLQHRYGLTQFLPDDSYTFEITPSIAGIPSNQTGNVNPVNIGSGHYKGKTNLSMPGVWDIGIIIKKNSTNISGNLRFKIRI